MEQLRTSTKTLTKGVKEFQSADKLKLSGNKAQKVTEALTRILASAEAANKIFKLNSDQSELNGKARDLLAKAFELNSK